MAILYLRVEIYPFLKLHILLYSNDLAIWHGLPNISNIKINKGYIEFDQALIFQGVSFHEVNNGQCEFYQVEIVQGISPPETAQFVF